MQKSGVKSHVFIINMLTLYVKWVKVEEVACITREKSMLMGTQESLIDAKNRYAVPAKFREDLGNKCVLTRGLDNCLILFPLSTWKEQQSKLQTLPKSDKDARKFIRFIYANAIECDIDKQGRTVLPENYRRQAGITKELVSIGMLDRVEIWAKDVYESDDDGGMLSPEALVKFSETYQV